MSKRISVGLLVLVLVMISGCLGAVDDEQAINQTLDKWQISYRTNEKDFLATMTNFVQLSALVYDSESESENLYVEFVGTKQSFAFLLTTQLDIEEIRLEDLEVTRTGNEAVVNATLYWDTDEVYQSLVRLEKHGNKWLFRELIIVFDRAV